MNRDRASLCVNGLLLCREGQSRQERRAEAVMVLSRIRINPPQIALKDSGWKDTGHDLAPTRDEQDSPIGRYAHQKRALLHMPGSLAAKRLVAAQGQFGSRFFGKRPRENQRVFERHTAAQAEIRRARMSGVAEQHHSSLTPALQGREIVRAVFQNARLFRRCNQALNRFVPALEHSQEFTPAAFG